MSLLTSLLRELENSSLSVNGRVEKCCEVAKALEYRGEYEEARKVLSAYWPRIGEAPKIAGLEPTTAAELPLRHCERESLTPFAALLEFIRIT